MVDDDAETDGTQNNEIIGLLQQVGQRLLSSEQERKELRIVLTDLQEKADQSERAYLTVQDRMNKTESAIAKRQKMIERAYKAQEERLEKAVSMADKIEEAIAQHSKINRRLDKLAQDRARTIRKLDRIEVAVTETQDALQSKSALLLGHEGVGGGALQAQAATNQDGLGEDAPWWRQHTAVRVGAVSAMVLLGVLGGWGMNKVQIGGAGLSGSASSYETASYDGYQQFEPPSFDSLADYQDVEETKQAANAFSETVDQVLASGTQSAAQKRAAKPVAQQEEPKPVAAAKPAENSKAAQAEAEEIDPMELDDERLIASMNENPGALAAQLNEIVPVAGTPTEKLDKVAEPPKNRTKEASYSPRQIEELSTADFIEGQKDPAPLSKRIKPDSSLPQVIKEVEKKAFEGMPEAQHDLAAIYTAGHGGVEVDFERAATWFRESAIRGVANARYNLGVLYHQGLGVDEDINMAVNWYRAAAEKGHPEAQYNLGIAYIEGIGTNYNPKKAAHYFEQAANEGILEAAYNLGLIYENGLTGDSKPDTALYWYKQAADMGSPEAKMALDQLAKTLGLFPEEVDRLYGTLPDKKAEATQAAPEPAVAAPASTTSAPQKTAARSSGEYEYIEAQPLNPVDATPARAIAEVDESVNESIKDNHAVIAQIQEQLIRIGLYPGPADGVNDSLTEDAIRSYQVHYDLKQDGRPSEALLVHMMTSDLGSSTEYGSGTE